MNDRPLIHLSLDPRDPEFITPAHLLCGKRIIMLLHCAIGLDELDNPDYGSTSDL